MDSVAGCVNGKVDDVPRLLAAEDRAALHHQLEDVLVAYLRAAELDVIRRGPIRDSIYHWRHARPPPFTRGEALKGDCVCDRESTRFEQHCGGSHRALAARR